MHSNLERTIGEMVGTGREILFSAIRQLEEPHKIREFVREYSHSRHCGYDLATGRDSTKLNRLRYSHALISALLKIDQRREAHFSPEACRSWTYALDPFK